MGYEFEVVAPEIEETVRASADPVEEARRLAAAKADDVAARLASRREPLVLIAADTICALGGDIIGKPRDRDHAKELLRRLSGSRHHVITGLCLLDTRSGRRILDAVSTAVTMKRMTEQEIQDYVASGEADGKAGAYAIQETADRYVEKVEGSLSNVVGLPTERLGEILRLLL